LDEQVTSFTSTLADLSENRKEGSKEIERIRWKLIAMVEKRIKELQKLLDEAFARKERLLQLAREKTAGRSESVASVGQLGEDLIRLGTEAEVYFFLSPHPPIDSLINI
jgi:hypothetical protein